LRITGAVFLILGGLWTAQELSGTIAIAAVLGLEGDLDLEWSDARHVLWLAFVTAVYWSMAVWLLRGRRYQLLFLRHFGFTEATQAVTLAARKQMGTSWRVITLDDKEAMPVGVSRTARITGLLATVLALVSLAWLITIIRNHLPPLLSLTSKYHDAPQDESESAMMIGVRDILGLEIAEFVFVIIPPAIFILVAATGILFAHRSRSLLIDRSDAINDAVGRVLSRTRKVFAPRLVIMGVSNEIWRDVVSRLLDVSHAVIIDVSQPTASLLWEIRAIQRVVAPYMVVVSQRSAEQLATNDSTDYAGLRSLLGTGPVLSYDPNELRSFADILYQTLRDHTRAIERAP
jgi:hypothetical protein